MFFSSAYAMAQQTHSDFQAYRDSIINEYKGFRKGLLDDYAKFLDGIWKEFEVFRGVKRNDTPKPTVVPQYKELPDAPQPHLMPAPEPQPAPRQEPTAPTVTPPGPPRPLVLPKPDAAPRACILFAWHEAQSPEHQGADHCRPRGQCPCQCLTIQSMGIIYNKNQRFL